MWEYFTTPINLETLEMLDATYRSEPSLSIRSRELVDAAPGEELNRLSAPLADSDSEFRDSILNRKFY